MSQFLERSYFIEPALSKHLAIAEKLKIIGKKYGRSAGEVVITWPLQNPAFTAAIVGGEALRRSTGSSGRGS